MNTLGKVVQTKDGSLSIEHPEYGEIYHSTEGALFEAHELYIKSSGFKESLFRELSVLDVGLGLSYNAMVTIDAWQNSKSKDIFLASLEINPDLVTSLATGKAPWQRDWPKEWTDACQRLEKQSESQWMAKIRHKKRGCTCYWSVDICDAVTSKLPRAKSGGWDFVWHDPFSPEKNPKMWDLDWFKKVKEVCSSESVLMTYSVSREVKDAVADAGWNYEKIKTPGKKRSWLIARP